jgi:hypothetical protein
MPKAGTVDKGSISGKLTRSPWIAHLEERNVKSLLFTAGVAASCSGYA